MDLELPRPYGAAGATATDGHAVRELQARAAAVVARRRAQQRSRGLSGPLARRGSGHDALTDLPGRQLFVDRARELLGECAPDRRVTVLILDLDQFKDLNGAYGHQAGNQALLTLAVRLRKAIPAGALLARMGGDAFALLCTLPAAYPGAAGALAEQLHSVLDEPVVLGEDVGPVRLLGSVGVASAGEAMDADVVGDRLLRRAELALYRAKRSHLDWAAYDRVLDDRAATRLQLATELRARIEAGLVDVVYRPVVDLQTDRVVGLHAAAQWQRTAEELIGPPELAALATDIGLLSELTGWVVHTVLEQTAAWAAEGRPLQCSVAVGVGCFDDPRFADRLLSLLEGDPGLVTLEVTGEVCDCAAAVDVLTDLAGRDVGVTLEGFGSRNSCFAALKTLPLSAVRLDRQLVAEALRSHRDLVILRSGVDLTLGLQLEVVADGVDSAAAADLLRDCGVSAALGALYADPMPGTELQHWLVGRSAGAAVPLERADPALVGEGADVAESVPLGGRQSSHPVLFYGDDQELIGELAAYVRRGLAGTGHALLILTAKHRDALLSALPARGIARAELEGRFVVLDAADLLSEFMRAGRPVPELFESAVADLVRAHAAAGWVHAYGEMVALLWLDGNVAAAMQLESLWNGLLSEVAFDLLCAYPLHDTDALHGELAEICNQHTSVLLGRGLDPYGSLRTPPVPGTSAPGWWPPVAGGAGAGGPTDEGRLGDVVALVDLDHVAQVNETAGQAAGDALLDAFAALLRETLRTRDLAFRLTSVDFLAVLPRTTPEQAMVVLEHVRLAWIARRSLPVTFSAGLAVCRDRDLDAAMLSADSAIYVAKAKGGNRFELAPSVARDAMEELRASLL